MGMCTIWCWCFRTSLRWRRGRFGLASFVHSFVFFVSSFSSLFAVMTIQCATKTCVPLLGFHARTNCVTAVARIFCMPRKWDVKLQILPVSMVTLIIKDFAQCKLTCKMRLSFWFRVLQPCKISWPQQCVISESLQPLFFFFRLRVLLATRGCVPVIDAIFIYFRSQRGGNCK